jgi:hypothetical protein
MGYDSDAKIDTYEHPTVQRRSAQSQEEDDVRMPALPHDAPFSLEVLVATVPRSSAPAGTDAEGSQVMKSTDTS